jgi:hypothetical protein
MDMREQLKDVCRGFAINALFSFPISHNTTRYTLLKILLFSEHHFAVNFTLRER